MIFSGVPIYAPSNNSILPGGSGIYVCIDNSTVSTMGEFIQVKNMNIFVKFLENCL